MNAAQLKEMFRAIDVVQDALEASLALAGRPPTDRRANAPVSFPTQDWVEACRQEFNRRWYLENGDDYESSPNVYGE
jgi:hypothetical protein